MILIIMARGIIMVAGLFMKMVSMLVMTKGVISNAVGTIICMETAFLSMLVTMVGMVIDTAGAVSV